MKAYIGNKEKVYILPDFDTYCDLDRKPQILEWSPRLKTLATELKINETYDKPSYHKLEELSPGMKIHHDIYGRGIIRGINTYGNISFINVVFMTCGEKSLSPQYAQFSIVC